MSPVLPSVNQAIARLLEISGMAGLQRGHNQLEIGLDLLPQADAALNCVSQASCAMVAVLIT
jgi:hypothetical protein